jgi:hypothetical protein
MDAALTQSGKTSTGCTLYADRASYMANPANPAVSGNVVVFQDQQADGALVSELFEYDPAAETLTRYEGSLSQQRALLHNVTLSSGHLTVFEQDLSLVQAHWTVQTPYELLDFQAYATPLAMR